MLVVDASFAVQASLAGGLERLAGHAAIAPPLLWSEAISALHELAWRRVISPEVAAIARDALARAPIARRRPSQLQDEAWEIATRLGWAKTYDAEYVALARLNRCALLTLDARLVRAAGGEVAMMPPTDL